MQANMMNNYKYKKIMMIQLATLLIFFSALVPPISDRAMAVKCNDPYLSNNDILWYCEDSVCSSSEVGVFSGTLPKETVAKMEADNVKGKAEASKARYDYAEKATGVPWQIIAALHYREGGMDPDASIADGSSLSAGTSADGLTIVSDPNEDTKLQTLHYLDMASLVYGIDKTALDKWNYDDWANAFLSYNRGSMFKDENMGYEKSPYVMNYLDTNHVNMSWSKADSYYKGTRLNGLYDMGAKDSNVGAMAVAAYLGFDFKGAGKGSGGSCTSGGAIQGEIAKTAINLSWPESHGLTLKPEYEAALEDVGLTGAGCGPNGADCGVFIATVLRSSGADPDMTIGTSAMMDRMKTNTDLYERINATDTGGLKPGDIFVVNQGTGEGALGHIMMYVGNEATDGGKDNASASCSERGADRGGNIFFEDTRGRGTYEIYRKK